MLRILVADQHEIVREGIRIMLEAQPEWVTATAHSFDQTIEHCRIHQPHIVLLGLLQSESKVASTIALIRSGSPTSEIVVFFLEHSEERARECFGAGARGYLLAKDSSPEIIACLSAVAKHQVFITPTLAPEESQRLTHGRRTGSVAAPRLTAREHEIVRHIAEGKRTHEIAWQLNISQKTVETHRSAIMRKLQGRSVADVVRYALRSRLVPL